MYNILLTIFIVIGVLLILFTMMQPQKQQDVLSSLAGGASELFSTQKARGFEAIMQRLSWIFGITWMILGFVLMYLSSH